ncbi:MAG: hypothetical protein AAF170_15760, partial [Bacteroidota bacterium]
MFASSSYGLRYFHDLLAENGLTVRLAFDVQDFGGASVEMKSSEWAGGAVLTWATGSGGDAASPVSPVAPSQAQVRIKPIATDPRVGTADIAALGALRTGSVRLRILADLTTAGTPDALVWMGYLPQGLVTDAPGEELVPVDLLFRDGFGLLDSRAATDPADANHTTTVRALVDWLRTWLAPLAADELAALSMVTRVDWRPYLDGAVVADTTDPVAAVRALAQAWTDPAAGGTGANVTSQMVAARQIASRVLGRMFFGRDQQGRVGWHLVQRSYIARQLAEDPAAELATFRHLLSGTDTDLAAPTRTTVSVLIDTDEWTVTRYQTRSRDGGVGQVASTYDFRPDLDNLIFNGSFEDGTTTTDADYWTGFDTGNNPFRSGYFNGDPEYGDQKVAKIPYVDITAGAQPANFIQQEGLSFLVTSAEADILFSFDYERQNGTATTQDDPRFRLDIGTYGLRVGTVETPDVVTDVFKGRDAVVPILPLLVQTTGVSTGTDADAVAGTEVLPVGTVIPFRTLAPTAGERGTLTLTRAAKVGDVQLHGDLSDSFDCTTNGVHYGDIAYFGPSGSAPEWLAFPGATVQGSVSRGTATYRCTANPVDGSAPISGFATFRVEGFVTDESDTGETFPELWVDDFVLRPQVRGSALSTVGRRASLTDASGLYVAGIPVADRGGHTLGDGPVPDSATRLQVSHDGGTTVVDSQQGENTGWKAGTYTNTSEASTERTIDALAAAESVAMLSGRESEANGPERIEVEMHLPHAGTASSRSDALFYPDACYLVWAPCKIAEPAITGEGEVVLTAP